MTKFVLYAPNVHTGGGAVLLKDLLSNASRRNVISAILDKRIFNQLNNSHLRNVHIKYWVSPNLLSRFFSEVILWRVGKNSKVLCFHNIPPILSQSKDIIVFFQNRLIIQSSVKKIITNRFPLIPFFERTLNILLHHKVTTYIVQTSSMKRGLEKTILKNSQTEVKILPFSTPLNTQLEINLNKKKWDFIYIASGDPHKNHLTLIEAWKILASEGIFPSLAITVDNRYSHLIELLEKERLAEKIKVTNLGKIDHDMALKLYIDTKALIFPSMLESFGLPLIEASALGVPIIAGELDFVRDVCIPTETFNPNSPISIARAIKRFLEIEEVPKEVISAKEFWDQVI